MSDCTDARALLGVYVLGAIEPAERARLEAHLESCPACRDELAGLAGLPALLGRVDEAQVTELAGPDPELLEGLLARAAAERRPAWGRRLGGGGSWAPLAAAACLLLVVGALFGGLLTGIGRDDRTASPPTVTPSVSPSTAPSPSPQGERISAEDPRTGVKGYVLLREKKWGTSLDFFLAGVKKGSRCKLRVVARDGRRDMLGSWYVPYDEGYGQYPASTMFRREELYAFEVIGLDGKPLLTIPA